MKHNQNTIQNFSTGRLTEHEDGDNAAMATQTVLCPRACSINGYVKNPSGGVGSGRETPILNTQTTARERQLHGREDQLSRRLQVIQARKKEIWTGINKKHGVRLASLNVKGRNDRNKKSKWPTVTTLLRKQRILVLGLQETHLDDEEANKIRIMCPKIELISNGNSKSKEGIAFAINKDLANNMTWVHKVLIEGRASRLTIMVEENRGLDIILIYAPNLDNDKVKFFSELEEKLKDELNCENAIIMGDFNSVEHELDRFPHRKDDNKVVESWKKIKKKYKLIDGWRASNQLSKGYTFTQPVTNSMSRIDRIYLNEKVYPYGYNWTHINSATLSDHDMVAVDILKKKLPYIGNGIWRMYKSDLEDANVVKSTDELLKRAEKEMESMVKKNENGIQELWAKTKEEVKRIIEAAKKSKTKQLEKEKKELNKRIEEKLKDIDDENQELVERRKEELSILKKTLSEKTRKELKSLQESTRARYRDKGEKYTKYWFNLNKKKPDSQVILALQKQDGSITNETKDMMEIALKHHEELQKRPEMTQDREEAIEKLKDKTEAKTTEQDKEYLKKLTTYDEVKESLKKAPNGSSPGVDGIIYEFYKEKMKKHEECNENPDIVRMLHMLINDIESKGIIKLKKDENPNRHEFTDGLMTLLFKKKEKWKIANYRPITLLNTDYKTYTKTIALKLSKVAKYMIHVDQAGFVPQRSLYDHTRTTNLAIEYCEQMDRNGCIVALDQEKAYDKIDHDYLWKILKHYEFPDEFIGRIKELYKDTGKSIMINGVVTKQYKVQRGVHQGDPMSCLLYNFAIEPLAEAIRKSKLEGIKINEKVNRLIVSLFADDTLVYLKESDNLNELRNIIDTFCKASTARFNMEKTEYLPIGNKEYREKVIRTRKFGNNKIENNVKIIKEGEAMRTLGSWVGNDANINVQWEEILKKQEETMEVWSKTNMSLKGKEIILKALVHSKAMFLATVNGMPKDIEEKMKKSFKDFLWDGKKNGLMSWNQIIAPREQGGLNIPDIRSRLEALDIMWIKKWLSPNKNKPKWTYILDEILNNSITKAPIIDKESRINWLKQSWHESEAKEVKLSKSIRNMLKTARKHNITLEPLKYSRKVKEAEILWHNRLMSKANYQWNKKSARCLRTEHQIKTIKELNDPDRQTTCNDKACRDMRVRLGKLVPKIIDPTTETPRKVKRRNLDLTPNRLKKNAESQESKVFNPDITVRKNVLEQVRLFANEKGSKNRQTKLKPKNPAYRKDPGPVKGSTKVMIVMITEKKGRAEQKIKVKVRLSGQTKSKISFKIQREKQTQDKALACALLWTLQKDKKNPLIIITKSKGLIRWIGGGINNAEDIGWLKTKEVKLWKIVLDKLRKTDRKIEIRLPNKKENSRLTKLKNKLKLRNPRTIEPVLNTKNKYLHSGAKLQALTQKLAYELTLKKAVESPGGPRTWRKIKAIQETLINKWDLRVEEEEIWNGLNKVKNNKVQDFIWKMIHDRIKCGEFFKYIPNWQDKQFCQCGKIESIEHILLKCELNHQNKLWKKVGKVWEKITGTKWISLEINDVMAIGCLKVDEKKIKKNKNLKTEVLRTLIETAIWSIWKNRNERIFNEQVETEDKQVKSWKESLRNEIKMEFIIAQQKPLGEKNKSLKRFIKKWSSENKVVRVTEKKSNGKRKVKINL